MSKTVISLEASGGNFSVAIYEEEQLECLEVIELIVPQGEKWKEIVCGGLSMRPHHMHTHTDYTVFKVNMPFFLIR
jgi:hypothetical protein